VGGKWGCKVVPRNFLLVINISHLLRSLIQISITTSLHLSPTFPPHLPPPLPVFRLPSPPPLAPNPTRVPTHTHLPHAPIHLISSSHPYPINTQTQLHTNAAHPSHLLSFHLLHTHTTLHLCPHPTPSYLLIHSASSRFFVLSSRISHARVPGRVHWLGALSAWMVARGLGDLGVVHRCGKGRGEEVVRTAG